MFDGFDNDKANALCREFSNHALKIEADVPTMILAAIRMLLTMLTIVTVPDPKTGRKRERIMEMLPGLIGAYEADFPIDEKKGGIQ